MTSLLARYRQEKQSAIDRLQAGSRLYDASAGRIEAALTGQGSPVLISHGSAGGYDMGLWLAQLIGGPFRYIAPSRFGYLRSASPPDATPEAQADIYAALLDTLGVEAVLLIGLSAGGASALQFALRHPGRCRGLILLSAVSQSVPPLSPLLRAIYPYMLKSDLVPWLFYRLAPQAVFQANGVSRSLLKRIEPDREKMQLLDALYWTTFPSSLRREGMLNDLERLSTFPVYPLERIRLPTLVIHAVNDPIIPFASGEFSAAAIPGAQFLRLEDGGHFACVTQREEVIPVIREFMQCHGAL